MFKYGKKSGDLQNTMNYAEAMIYLPVISSLPGVSALVNAVL